MCLARLLAPALALVAFASAAQGGPISSLVIFGDSLSDTGNVYAATSATTPAPPYFNGRYSNGPVWVEKLAEELNLPAPTPSLLGGNNHAFGGAMSGFGFSPLSTPNIGTQILGYLASNTPSSDQLFVVWGGSNDYILGGETNPLVPVTNLMTDLSLLAASGAKQFLVPNLPPLGNLPGNAANVDDLNLATALFNTALDAALDQFAEDFDVTVHKLDVFTLTEAVLFDPLAYDFQNITNAALLDGQTDGAGYLFFDPYHPTTQAHAIIGQTAAGMFETPEPSSMVLLLTAGFVALRWRRR